MARAKLIVAMALLAGAAIPGVPDFAFAGQPPGTVASDRDLIRTLAGSELTAKALSAARGGTGLNISQTTSTTNNTLNLDATSSGTVNGASVLGSMSGSAAGNIVNSSGIINQFSNSGSNVMMNSSVAFFITAQ